MIDTAVGILNVPELEALISVNVELAARYQVVVDDPDAEPGTRRTAEALAAWRRARARYFHGECDETERVEAAHELDPGTSFGGASGPVETEDRLVSGGSTVYSAPSSGAPRAAVHPSLRPGRQPNQREPDETINQSPNDQPCAHRCAGNSAGLLH